jgi:glycosyltransferase involved in cell wall biosynthesis
MNFLIVTQVAHLQKQQQYYAYSPYVNEMNIWLKYVDSVTIVAPLSKPVLTAVDTSYCHDTINFESVAAFSLNSFASVLRTLLVLPIICFKIFIAMYNADHIHLRCPGNMGLLGCFLQVFFPSKAKSAKYAGNWDPKSKQPWSYRLQHYILNNTFLTRNMQVLVYGEWEAMSSNIKPFFTASYYQKDVIEVPVRDLSSAIQMIFVGTLSIGKRPLYAIQLVGALREMGVNVVLDLYGDGAEKDLLHEYVEQNDLTNFVFFKGNQTAQVVCTAYQNSHFLILASQSEGWPKAVAEAMFWGCLPIATPISCVPNMLDKGSRGLLLSLVFEQDVLSIKKLVANETLYQIKCGAAMNWSRQYTLDYFEKEIRAVLLLNI